MIPWTVEGVSLHGMRGDDGGLFIGGVQQAMLGIFGYLWATKVVNLENSSGAN